MKGIDVKEKLKKEGYKLKDIAINLGYANDQRLHSALKSDDISSGLLENIARVINKNVYWFYDDDSESSNNNIKSLIGILDKTLTEKDKQIDRLLSIIEQSKV